MSRETRKNIKKLLGKSPRKELGRDVISVGSAGVSGVATHTLLTDNSISIFNAQRDGLLDGFVVQVYPSLTEGQLDVALSVNGVVKASGALTLATASRSASWFWDANSDNEIVLSSGHSIEMQYAIPTSLSPGVTSRRIQARALITYTE